MPETPKPVEAKINASPAPEAQDRSRDESSNSTARSESNDDDGSKERRRIDGPRGTSEPQRRSDDKIPSTVVELLERIFKPAEKSEKEAARPARRPEPGVAPSRAPQTTGTLGKPEPKPKATAPVSARGRAPVAHAMPSPASTAVGVLGVNMSSKAIARARALGFTVSESTRASRLGVSLVNLIAPPGFDAASAHEKLAQDVPNGMLAFNQPYRIYHAATGIPGANRKPPIPAPMATACGTDQCLGQALVGWKQALGSCASGVRIGVIDTGFDQAHPAFKGRTIDLRHSSAAGQRPGGSGRPAPDWHGTGILALLAGTSASPTPGLIPQASFHVVDAFSADSSGQPVSDTLTLIEALNWLAERKVQIVNMSISGPPDELLRKAIDRLASRGILIVAAVGNDGPSSPPAYPAAYPSVLAVTAVGSDLHVYRHAIRGAHVDFAAPGVKIWTAAPQGQADYHSGTSFAVPYATAVLAAIYRHLPVKSKAEALQRLAFIDLGSPGKDSTYGRGLLLAPSGCDPRQKPITPALVAAASGRSTK